MNRIVTTSSLRVLSIGSSLSWAFLSASEESENSYHFIKEIRALSHSTLSSSFLTQRLSQVSSAFNPELTRMEGAAEHLNESQIEQEEKTTKKVTTYDFIIVGYGNAGQSALRTLQHKCKDAKIAVVDSLRSSPNGRNKTDYYMETATGLDPINRTLQLSSRPNEDLRYKHGILIATGARGAPPPLELFEASALPRVLELRSTELLGNIKRPIMAPDKVRGVVVDAASQGGKIGVLGSGWEALDLVCAAEKAGRKKPTIVFGNPGPVWNILPSYLSSDLRKKLIKKDIDIHDRSIVRYVAEHYNKRTKKLELHTAKLYDLLETRRTTLDLMVGKDFPLNDDRNLMLNLFLRLIYFSTVAPDCFGAKGTAALPTKEIPDRMRESSDGRPWYKTWSQLAKSSPNKPSIVVCFEDDGRIAVNPELCAASGVFAAGSVAKYPNSTTGNSSIAGEGAEDGKEAGRIAAINMSKQYSSRLSFSFPDDTIHSFAASSIPGKQRTLLVLVIVVPLFHKFSPFLLGKYGDPILHHTREKGM